MTAKTHTSSAWLAAPGVITALMESGFEEDDITSLLETGAGPNARDRRGQTPMHRVARFAASADVAAALLEAGADPDARDREGRTPLHVAARWCANPATIRVLLELGADSQAKDNAGMTPLQVARVCRIPGEVQDEVVLALEQLGQTPDAPATTDEQWDALCAAAAAEGVALKEYIIRELGHRAGVATGG